MKLQRVGEVDEVLSDRGLLGHARRLRLAKARAAVAAQVRDQHAKTGVRQRRRDIVVRVHIIRKSVQQDDREA